MYTPPKIGDVVTHGNSTTPMVVIDIENREKLDSVSYDRIYYLIEESRLSSITNLVEANKLLTYATVVHINGYTSKDWGFHKVNCAPYEIKNVNCFSIRQKKAKTITIYE